MGLLCSLGSSLLWSSVCCLWLMKVGMYVRGDALNPQECDSRTSKPCQAMVGYMASANFNLSHVASLFSLNYTSLLGPNDIDPSLPNLSGLVLPPLTKPYLIPQSCGCTGGTYITSTNYTVVNGDTLSGIASQFLDFATYPEIAKVSGIPNPDQIEAGQNILIPIPCACSNASNSLSLSYQVQQEDSLSKIAQEYNTSTLQLQDLNSIVNSSEIEASQVLFVPLPVCKANFSQGALDGNLTVVEGAYELTADGCVQCNCNNGSMRCIPTAVACSNVKCSSSSLTLGASNASQSSQGCSVQSCVYKGYTTQSGILSSLEVAQDLECPVAPAPETFYKPPTGLVVAPAASPPPVTTSTSPTTSSSSPPPPPTPTSNPNSATPLRNFFGWCWCLLVLPGFFMI